MRTATIATALTLVLYGLLFCPASSTFPVKMPGSLDAELFLSVIAKMRAGESYYQALGQEQVARNYPTKPVFAWRMPTLLEMEAALPSLGWSIAILSAIGLAAAGLWWRHLGIRLLGVEWLAIPILASSLPLWAWLAPRDVTLHDLWAGQLICLSLACWANNHRRASLAAAAFAVAIRELALPFVIVMAAMDWFERRRRESIAWVGLVGAFAVGLAWHAERVAANLPPGGYANSWAVVGGWCFDLATARTNVVLLMAPSVALAIAVPAMLLALFTWPSPTGRRVAVVAAAYFAMFTLIGQPFNWYWGLLIAPILPLGLAFHLTSWQAKRRSGRRISIL